jgi:uncharacterized membrane protein YeaQ/YmgE (transglycosylase-associated protein family)
MNIALWLLAGSLLGWVCCARLGINEGRGMIVSAIIGAVGGFLGGKVIAPMFTAPAVVTGDFSMAALVCAAAAAGAALFASNMVHDRWGV